MRVASCVLLLAGCLPVVACSSRSATGMASSGAEPAQMETLRIGRGAEAVDAQRLLVRQVALRLEADDPVELAGPLSEVAARAGGFVEQSSITQGERLEMVVRVPVAQLDSVLAHIERLATIKERRESALDVTEETIDVESRLANLLALRDRLRSLLQSAAGVQDVIAVERELARVQSDIDSFDARLKYLRSNVALAQVSIRVDQRRVLGPLGVAAAGVVWVISKLFVIR